VDVEHLVPFVEAFDRANDHAIGVLAAEAGLANDVRHDSIVSWSDSGMCDLSRRVSGSTSTGTSGRLKRLAAPAAEGSAASGGKLLTSNDFGDPLVSGNRIGRFRECQAAESEASNVHSRHEKCSTLSRSWLDRKMRQIAGFRAKLPSGRAFAA
jgi:hypothetical protein